MAKHFYTEVSREMLTLENGRLSEPLTITVYNNSDQPQSPNCFASFRLELLAAGREPKASDDWYRLVPAVSYKIPPGDSTQFEVEVLKIPPISDNFAGLINLSARVYSPELDEKESENIRLIVAGDSIRPPRISLSEQKFTAFPEEEVSIKLSLKNPNRRAVTYGVRLNGIDREWLGREQIKSLKLEAGDDGTLSFTCNIPEPAKAPSKRYPITFEIVSPVQFVSAAQASLTVLPRGVVDFVCDPVERWLPEKSGRWLNPRQYETTVDLVFNNKSNLNAKCEITVFSLARRFKLFKRRKHKRVFYGTEQVEVQPGDIVPIPMRIEQRASLLGWGRRRTFQLEPVCLEQKVQLERSYLKGEEPLQKSVSKFVLHVAPVIPLWLQLLGISAIGVILLTLMTVPGQHKGAIKDIEINGQGNEAISASEDGSVRRWRIQGKRLVPIEVVSQDSEGKSALTVLYRPVNNDEVVVGFENGTAKIFSQISENPLEFQAANGNRVLDLAFSRDARILFSAHGNGEVNRWQADLSQRQSSSQVGSRAIKVDFAAYAIALFGNNDSHLAISGEYNQLAIADLNDETVIRIPYASGGKMDVISDIATSEKHPNRLAIADEQGRISLWEISPLAIEECKRSQSSQDHKGCESIKPIDQWSRHSEGAVRSIAFTRNGCYLASSGDNKKVMLWPLTKGGTRNLSVGEQVLRGSSDTVNAIDIVQTKSNVLHIVSGGDDHHVNLTRYHIPDNSSSDSCP